MQVTYQPKPSAAAVIAVLVPEGGKLGARALALDAQLDGAIARAVTAPAFKAKREQIIELIAPAKDGPRRVLIAGAGAPKELNARNTRSLGGAVAAHLMAAHEPELELLVDTPKGAPLGEGEFAANLAMGLRLRNYRFGKYQTKAKPDKPKLLAAATLVTARTAEAKRLDERLAAVADGVHFARDLVNEPPNALYPEEFGARMKALAKLGVKVEVLDVAAMKKLGMGAILAVGGGSVRPPRLLVLHYNGAKKKGDGPIAFVGKGVCFDAGGLCLKKPSGMMTMKGDMAGGAAVVGAIHALAARKAKVDAVGVVGLVENLPSGSAYKPGDIVTTMSGRTIEVFDTDAEGRMVLVDALYYTATRFKPRCIVDLATLTYAVMAAVGGAYSGIFSNDDKLNKQLTAAGEATGERLWRLPIDGYYDANLESGIADFRHHSPDDESADAAHAAALLKNFVEDRPWAHLDIANKEFTGKDRPLVPTGATGYAVALLEEFAAGLEG
ncbi:leucyl aminopeptidase [Dongia sedimenti]|uniref:Probable cytosol aminopeptidase n=1 Tax=Dongia sedimenti TaxID=3064282 RepID=A0ABU0YJB9_9PROT|nr:leucyl aminopeptidase [Rhodospirillaceae bacterium R-7]